MEEDVEDMEARTSRIKYNSNHSPEHSQVPFTMLSWRAYTPFLGMYRDVRNRLPYYISDWTDALNYRVIPSTLLTFFANILPALAFAYELEQKTGKYGVNEILISTFMAAAAFSIIGAQPLTIVGVTGPITVLNTSMYTIIQEADGPYPKPDYLEFVGWVYVISAIMHLLIAVFNLSNCLRGVTKFTCQTFGFYVGWIYLLLGVQVIARESESNAPIASLTFSCFLAATFFTLHHIFMFASISPFWTHLVRRFLADYGLPISVVAKLPTVGGFAYTATDRQTWVVHFWNTPARWVGIAVAFAALLTLLFLFDHQVSAIIGQGSEFKLKKPPGFHWDFALLGVTTLLAGVFGLIAPNGLIPQTPIHTQSLVYTETRVVEEPDEVDGETGDGNALGSSEARTEADAAHEKVSQPTHRRKIEEPAGVVEQRVTNLAQGGLALAFATGPFLQAVNKIPTGVLAGLFWSLGLQALYGNMITEHISYLLKDRHKTARDDKYHRVRKSRIWLFVLFELVGFGATYAVSVIQRSAIGFPVIIILLIPFRTYIVPKCGFTQTELDILDGMAASDFTMRGLTL